MTQPEQWKQIGNSNHEISDRGRVRTNKGRWRSRGIGIRKLRLLIGYPSISLLVDDVCQQYYIHDLVLTAFIGPRPIDAQCRHLNGDKTDNRIENLSWGTRVENENDKIGHGRTNRGERNGQSVLTHEEVEAIKAATGPRGIITKLAKQYGVSHGTISMIRSGKRWQHD